MKLKYLGAAVGILFAFGLAVTAALYCTSFATAVLNAAQIYDRWKIAGLAIGTLIFLLLVNVAGVQWVIRFQILLEMVSKFWSKICNNFHNLYFENLKKLSSLRQQQSIL